MAVAVDVSRVEQLSELEADVQKRFGGTDILMNNAGIQPGSKMFGPAGKLAARARRQPVGRDPWHAGVRA